MTRAETIQIMGILQVAFPSYYRNVSTADASAAVSLWTELFSEDPAELVAAAVKALIATQVEGYPPTIGAVKAKLRELTEPESLTAAQAWAMVERACANGVYGAQEEFDRLPTIIQRAVGSPNQLREWGNMDADTVKSVVASNFQRSFAIIQKREKEMALIPPDVRNLLASAAEKMFMALPETEQSHGNEL